MPSQPARESSSLGQLSVQAFFNQIVWEGPAARLATLPESVETSSIETVAQFFDTFPWSGEAVLRPPAGLLNRSPQEAQENATLTLEAFSDLF